MSRSGNETGLLNGFEIPNPKLSETTTSMIGERGTGLAKMIGLFE